MVKIRQRSKAKVSFGETVWHNETGKLLLEPGQYAFLQGVIIPFLDLAYKLAVCPENKPDQEVPEVVDKAVKTGGRPLLNMRQVEGPL